MQGRLEIDCDAEDVMVKTVIMGSSTPQINKLGKQNNNLKIWLDSAEFQESAKKEAQFKD